MDLSGVTGGLISGDSIIALKVGCYGIILRQTTQLSRVSDVAFDGITYPVTDLGNQNNVTP